jgi:hypothetical protein
MVCASPVLSTKDPWGIQDFPRNSRLNSLGSVTRIFAAIALGLMGGALQVQGAAATDAWQPSPMAA